MERRDGPFATCQKGFREALCQFGNRLEAYPTTAIRLSFALAASKGRVDVAALVDKPASPLLEHARSEMLRQLRASHACSLAAPIRYLPMGKARC